MPTVLRKGPFRFFFYSNKGTEPVHIYVEKAGAVAKFWLDPIRLEYAHGLKSSDIPRIRDIIEDNQQFLIEAWNEYFS